MKTYILQKDLPTAKAGTEFTWDSISNMYKSDSPTDYSSIYYEKSVMQDTEWFKPKDTLKPIITNWYNSGEAGVVTEVRFIVSTSEQVFSIRLERLAEIVIAESKGELFIGDPKDKPEREKRYTEKELLEA